MSKHARDRRPYVKPVKRIELSEQNIKLRTILIVVFLSIAVVSIMVGLVSMLNTDPGWVEVEINASEANCSGDFAFVYNFGRSGMSATLENKQLTALYSDLTTSAYQIFSAEVEAEGVNNLRYLNDHVNETVTVDPVLYEALVLVEQYGSRHPYLAPIYVEYNRIFITENDGEAAQYDPAQNPELVPYLQETAAYTSDPAMVSIALLGENQVRLNVSDAYLAYAEEYGIDTFVDLNWMKNGFIIDYLADQLAANGFTNGYLSSYDGFTRNLDTSGESYSFNIFDRQGREAFLPARLNYASPISIVYLRDYPMSQQDRWHYYAFESGEIATIFLDPADGMSKSSIDSLVSYSETAGCAEILLQTGPVFIAEDFSADTLAALSGEAIYSVWCEGNTLCYNEPDAELVLAEDAAASYTKAYQE